MSTIVNNPSAITPAYKPIVWQSLFETTESEVRSAVVGVYKNGSQIATYRVPWRVKTGPVTGTYGYIFDIDIQAFCQNELLPNLEAVSSTLQNISYISIGTQPDFHNTFSITIAYEYLDTTTNQIVQTSVTDESDAVTVIPVTFALSWNAGDWTNFLRPFIQDIGSNKLGKLFTDCIETDICIQDRATQVCYTVPVSGSTPNCLVVIDSVGAECISDFDWAAVPFLQIQTGCGAFPYIDFSTPPTILENSTYTVFPAYRDGRAWTQTHKAITYNVKPYEPTRYLRLMWLNQYGAQDSISFVGNVSKIRKETVTTAERQLDYGVTTNQNVNQRGKYHSDMSFSTGYSVKVQFQKREYMQFLNGLFSSVEIYSQEIAQETETVYNNPVIITDRQEVEYYQGKIWYVTLEFKVWIANDLITHRL